MIDALARALDPAADGARLAQLRSGAALLLGLAALHGVALAAAVAARARRRAAPAPAALWTPGPRPPHEPGPRAFALGLAALLVAASALRAVGLEQDLWMDEVFTLTDFVRLPVGLILTSYPHDNQHLLYTLLAHASCALLGESATALRLPAVVLGVGSLAALARLGALVLGRREALMAVALLAFSYHHVWFSQNARGYTGLLLGTLLATELFLRGLWRGRPGTWLAYAGVVALSTWVHLTMVFVPAGHALVGAFLAVRRLRALAPGDTEGRRALALAAGRAAGGLVLAGTLTLTLYALVLPQMLAFFTRPGGGSTTAAVEWKNPLWLVNETLRGLGLGLALGWLGLLAGLAAFAVGAGALLRRDPVFAALAALPAVLGAGALVALGRNLWPRFFFHEAGFAALAAAAGASAVAAALVRGAGRAGDARLAPRLASLAIGLLVLASAVALPRAWRLPKQDYRGPVARIEAEAAPGDRVVALDVAGEVYRRYYAPPHWTSARDEAELAARLAPAGRTWVVYTLPRYLAATQPGLVARLETDYELVAAFPGTVGDGVLVVRRSRAADASRR